MSVVYEVHYRDAGEAAAAHADAALGGVAINAHVLEDWRHTKSCVEDLHRYELYCISDGVAIGVAALVVETDFNLGECVTIVAAASADRRGFMRYVIRFAKQWAKQLGIRYVAYTKTLSRLRYELRYLEV